MNEFLLKELLGIPDGDYENVSSGNFEDLCCSQLSKFGNIERQVLVKNRGDGRRGKIDLVFGYNNLLIPIEIDRKSIRKKSIYKVKSYNNENAFCIIRSPFQVIKV